MDHAVQRSSARLGFQWRRSVKRSLVDQESKDLIVNVLKDVCTFWTLDNVLPSMHTFEFDVVAW